MNRGERDPVRREFVESLGFRVYDYCNIIIIIETNKIDKIKTLIWVGG